MFDKGSLVSFTEAYERAMMSAERQVYVEAVAEEEGAGRPLGPTSIRLPCALSRRGAFD